MRNWSKIVIILGFVSMFVVPCFWIDDCTSLLKTHRDIVYNGNTNITSLTKHFCSKVASLACEDTSAWESIPDYFYANQSVFLSILCNSVWVWGEYSQTKEYLNKSWFVDFWIVGSMTRYTEKCHPDGTMNDCNYAYNLPLIFTKIMDDFFSIKQARSLWVDKLDDSISLQEYADNFSKEYFVWLTYKDWTESTICDPNNDYYRTTCKKLKNYMKDARNLLKNTEVINVEKLQDKWKGIDCNNKRKENIVYCGLLWSKSDYMYINALYNEYFWYKLFLSYYSVNIEGYDYLDGRYSNISDKIDENAEKRALVEDQLQKSKKAITLSLRMLAEISDSFPLHVWFLMYQDDAMTFMDELSKIYPPIRTLYDKLRNVQIKE